MAVNAWLAGHGDASRQERFARALAVAGRFRSGKHDISLEHDRELGEIHRW